MIVYLASYPRCGNSLLRDIIHAYFKYPTTDIYPNTPNYPVKFAHATNWRIENQVTLWDKRNIRLVWNQWVALYDRTAESERKNMRYLLHGCIKTLTPEHRQRFAAEDNIFFLKTHERPYAQFYDGEYVIQPVRHPGAVFRSYANLLSKNADQPLTLDSFIKGEGEFGSWSDYHRAWNDAIDSLNGRYLRLYYENMVNDQLPSAQQIHEFLRLPYDSAGQIRAFEGRHQHNPHMFGFGSNDGWENAFTAEQLRMTWKHHHEMMTFFGYPEPDYTLAAKPS